MIVFLYLIPVFLQIFLGTYVYQKSPQDKKNRLFTIWMFMFFIANLAGLYMQVAPDNETKSLGNPFFISFGAFLGGGLLMCMVLSSLYYPKFLETKKLFYPLLIVSIFGVSLSFLSIIPGLPIITDGVIYQGHIFVPKMGRFFFLIPIYMIFISLLDFSLLTLGFINGGKNERRQIPWIFLSILITALMGMLAGKEFDLIGKFVLNFLSMTPVLFFAYFILKGKLFSPIEIAIGKTLSSMKEGFLVLDNGYKILEINPSAKEIFENNLDEFVKSIPQLIEQNQKEIILTEPKEKIISLGISEINDDKGNKSGLLVLSRDVTDKRRAEKEIEDGKNFLDKMIETSVDGIFVTDTGGKIIRANKAGLNITGYEFSEIKGEHMAIFTPEEEKYYKELMKMVEELKEHGKVKYYETSIKNKNNKIIPVELNIAQMFDSNGIGIGGTIVMRDLREKRDMQAQLLQTGKLAAIGELAAGVAHELNNPLAGILGYSQLILEKMGKLKAETIKPEDLGKITTYQTYIEKESQRCKSIVLSLLKFSRASQFEFADINVNSVLEDTFVFTEHNLVIKKIEFLKDLAPQELLVKGNSHPLQQVFTNIILNAQKAMSNGGGKLIAKSRMAEKPGNNGNGKWIEVEFSDTGCGIPDEIINRIFEPFFTTKPIGEGTGLGLSVSYGIIKEHKGEIKVKSKAGEGTSFTISLPSALN